MNPNWVEIPFEKFAAPNFRVWGLDWLLLCAGNEKAFNAMTVGWGYFGTMWGYPAAVTVVRPTRYTREFLDRSDTFTLSSFGNGRREALTMLGNTSGRLVPDKTVKAGLTPVPSLKAEAPSFAEAQWVIECRKLYVGEFQKANFCDPALYDKIYPQGGAHLVYTGEVIAVRGEKAFAAEASQEEVRHG